ncbi:MAG TPA: SDR family oxidoreductase [Gammaproteobacteria bacterium]|nr:SDR family oxidoreductase [Gammaproteobacteria bacterium]
MQLTRRSSAEQVTKGIDLTGKMVLITGINSGIGHETARVLSLRGACVIGTARSLDKATQACSSFGSKAIPIACELTDLDSVRSALESIKSYTDQLDIIIANAGIMALPKLETANGLEKQFATNHIGHFLLLTELLAQVKAAQSARIVIVSSSAHTGAPAGGIELDNLDGSRGYSAWRAYSQSKLANILFANELARRLKDDGVMVNSLHPGVIATNLGRHMNPLLGVAFGIFGFWAMKNVGQGAATSCYLAVHPDVQGVTGKYFSDCKESKPLQLSQSEELAAKLWERSEELVAV